MENCHKIAVDVWIFFTVNGRGAEHCDEHLQTTSLNSLIFLHMLFVQTVQLVPHLAALQYVVYLRFGTWREDFHGPNGNVSLPQQCRAQTNAPCSVVQVASSLTLGESFIQEVPRAESAMHYCFACLCHRSRDVTVRYAGHCQCNIKTSSFEIQWSHDTRSHHVTTWHTWHRRRPMIGT